MYFHKPMTSFFFFLQKYFKVTYPVFNTRFPGFQSLGRFCCRKTRGKQHFWKSDYFVREIKASALRGGKSRKCCVNEGKEIFCSIHRKKRKMRK